MLARFPDELEADLAEVYQLDLRRMGRDYSCAHAACLAAQLPPTSRTMRAAMTGEQRERVGWGSELGVLVAILNCVRWLQWSRTEDAQRRGARPPEPIVPPGMDAHGKDGGSALALPGEEYKRRLAAIHAAHPRQEPTE